MAAAADLGRRLRRIPGFRMLSWGAVACLFLFALSHLRRSLVERTRHAIVLAEVDSTLIPECAQVPPARLAQLQGSTQMNIHTFRGGAQLAPEQKISNLVPVCIIVAVPQSPPAVGVYKDVPVEGHGPDLIHLYVNSTWVRMPIPPLKPFPGQPAVLELQAQGAILYYVELALTDPGAYEISAEREYKNWRWAKQWWHNKTESAVHFLTGHVEPVADIEDVVEKIMEVNRVIHDGVPLDPVPVAPSKVHPPTINVVGRKHPDLPGAEKKRCSALSGFEAGQGRWYKQDAFPNLPTDLADEWGFIYMPDDCTLDYFTPLDVTNCLAGKTIQVFGDSNSRRLSRAIMSGGRWCHNTTARCQHEDWGDHVVKAVFNFDRETLDEEIEKPEHNGQFELNDKKPFSWGKNSVLYFSFMQSIVMAPKDWLSAFYDPADFTIAEEGELIPFGARQIRPGAVPRAPTDMAQPDLVVVGVGAWDEAFDETYQQFEDTLPTFRDTLLTAYDPLKTKLALRLSQGLCCRRNFTEDLRRFSGGRIAKMLSIIREAWRIESGRAWDGRVAVLDASGMCGRPEVINDYGIVGSNHQRASHVRLELQILLNQVCERDHEGVAVWKDDTRFDL